MGGQMLAQVSPESHKIQPCPGDERRHSGSAVRARHGDTVNGGLRNTWKCVTNCLHFGRRDVLAFPAKGVADAVDKVEVALLVPSHQVTGTKPGVSRIEHIVENLVRAGLLAAVAFEPVARVGRIFENSPNSFPRFGSSASNAESSVVSHRLAFVGVDAHQCRGESMSQKQRDTANGAGLALDVK